MSGHAGADAFENPSPPSVRPLIRQASPATFSRKGRRKITCTGPRPGHSVPMTQPPADPVALRSAKAIATGAQATGAAAVGGAMVWMLAMGAMAVGAMAIGALSVGRLGVGRARVRRLHVDDLTIGVLRVGRIERD